MKIIIFVIGVLCMASAETLDKHHNYDEMLEIMQSVANRCSSITMLYNLSSLSDEPPYTTTRGRELAVIVFSDEPEKHEIRKCNYCFCVGGALGLNCTGSSDVP